MSETVTTRSTIWLSGALWTSATCRASSPARRRVTGPLTSTPSARRARAKYVAAVLEATRVKLRINSQPGGAEIWINGELRGVTPKVLEGLDPETVKQVELRLGDFAPETRPLDWSQGDTIDVEVTGVGRLSNTVVETPAPRAAVGFPPSPDSEGVRRVALGNEERLPDKFKSK